MTTAIAAVPTDVTFPVTVVIAVSIASTIRVTFNFYSDGINRSANARVDADETHREDHGQSGPGYYCPVHWFDSV